MAEDNKKVNPGGTGMVVAGLLAVFVGLWMVGQTMATEGELLKLKLNAVADDLETLTFQMKAMEAKLEKLSAAEHAMAAAAPADPAAAPAAPAAAPAAPAAAPAAAPTGEVVAAAPAEE